MACKLRLENECLNKTASIVRLPLEAAEQIINLPNNTLVGTIDDNYVFELQSNDTSIKLVPNSVAVSDHVVCCFNLDQQNPIHISDSILLGIVDKSITYTTNVDPMEKLKLLRDKKQQLSSSNTFSAQAEFNDKMSDNNDDEDGHASDDDDDDEDTSDIDDSDDNKKLFNFYKDDESNNGINGSHAVNIDQVTNRLFKLLLEGPEEGLPLIKIKKRIKVPIKILRTVLDQICNLRKFSTKRALYTIKPQYKPNT